MHHLVTRISWALCLVGLASSYRHHIETIPAAQSNLASIAQYISSHNGLDAPHVTPINDSAYDWWYFDAYSEDTLTSVVVVFFNAPATAFPFSAAPPTDIAEAYLFVSVPGQPFLVQQPIPATQATVDFAGNGASGDWKGSGFSFTGEPDMSEYTISIDNPELAFKGELSFKSIAPAHYPCDRAKSGVTMEIMPNVGWSNAVPQAVAEVHLTANGTKVDFTGVGYHDKNWGATPFPTSVASWFWGHGSLGPYTIVWYDALSPTSEEYVSAYVAKTSSSPNTSASSPSAPPLFTDIVTKSCALSSIAVRPSGPHDIYPPSLAAPAPASGYFHVEIALGDDGDAGSLVFDVVPSVEIVVVPGPVGELYDRWTGTLKGGIVGGEGKQGVVWTGTALYEQFMLGV